MHNKLLVVDNAIALMGGRNIGDQYFQIDPDSQFADVDLFVAGTVAQQLSATFDEFWDNALSIPVEALSGGKSSHADLREHREELGEERQQLKVNGIDYVKRIATGELFNGTISGRLPLVWAHAQLISDSPDKKKVENTEIGLIIDSPALAQQVGARFDAMVQPVNSYQLALRPSAAGGAPDLVWRTQEGGKVIEYDTEPARSRWQRLKVNILSLLPLDKEL